MCISCTIVFRWFEWINELNWYIIDDFSFLKNQSSQLIWRVAVFEHDFLPFLKSHCNNKIYRFGLLYIVYRFLYLSVAHMKSHYSPFLQCIVKYIHFENSSILLMFFVILDTTRIIWDPHIIWFDSRVYVYNWKMNRHSIHCVFILFITNFFLTRRLLRQPYNFWLLL